MMQGLNAGDRAAPPALALDVRSWPIIEWSARRIQQIVLLHLASRCTEAVDRADIASQHGSTLWCGLVSSGLVGVSWSWQHIAPGVLVIADPLAICSNLRWLGDDGHVLGAIAGAALHNRLVAGLHWQHAVQGAVQANIPAPVVSWPEQPFARC
jgi:hypothetical protein